MSNDHSKTAQLQRLRDEDLLHGWGAALSIGRKALNTVLQDAFLASLSKLTYLEPFDDRFAINEGNSQLIEIEGLVLGPAQVSFENAVSTDRWVTVRMNLLAGDYRYWLHLAGEPPRFHRSFTIRESMGFTLEARCQLALKLDPVALQRHIVLDLGEATQFTCNLGETDYERTQIGRRLQQWLVEQPEERRVLRLGSFDLRNYLPLSLTYGDLITQPAPWASEPGAEGDGALVVFMQTGVDWDPGTLPAGNYPYQLPKDDSTDVALATQEDLQDLKLGEPADVMKSLRLGNERRVSLMETHRLKASLSYGVLERGTHSRELLPAITALGATEQCQFSMSGGSGAIEWRARNLFRPLASGSIDAGVYRARASQDFVKQTQMVLVTGHAQNDDDGITASALVVEADQPLTIAPQTVNWSIGDPPIEFVAAGGSAMTWTLEGEGLGTLRAQDNRATFTPGTPTDPAPPVQRQRVRVRYNDNGRDYITEACVIIVNRPASLNVEPFHVARQNAIEAIQFSVPEDWREALAKTGTRPPDKLELSDFVWTVIGEGDITPEGLYTPPASPVSSASVVRVVLRGRVSGYAIIEHGQRQGTRSASVAGWNALDKFYVRTVTAPQCYANGMQQIQVQVEIATKDPGDGSHSPISDDELQTLKFYVVGGGELRVVDVGIEPPVPGTPGTWAMRRSHNPLLEMVQAAGASTTPVPAADGRTIWNYWLQTTSTVPVEIYAMFKQSGLGGKWFNSETQSQDNGKVAVQGRTLPTYDPSRDYPWTDGDKRVKQEGSVVGNDTFNYMTLTVDYWKLTHVLADKRIPFVQIDVDGLDNKSVMRWASEEYEDELCSYSGFMFGGEQEQMIYDGNLARMAGKRGLTLEQVQPNRRPANGELLISLNRVTNFRQRYETPDDPDILTDEEAPQREHLMRAFKFRLLDQQGNRHDLQISYEGAGRDGRNTFTLSKQPPRT